MRPDRHAHALQHRPVLGDRAVVDRHARIVDDLVDDAVGIGLRHPAIVVDRLGPVLGTARIDLVDGDHLARLRLLDQVVVVKAPPRRGIAAEGLAGEVGIAARPRRQIEDLDLEHVAGLGAAHEDRAGQDMDAKALARAAAVHRGVHRPGATAVDALAALIPAEHALRPGIALDHPLGVVIGMMGQGLQRDQIARVHVQSRLAALAEIAPVHGVGIGRQDMVGGACRHLLAGLLGGGVAGEQRAQRERGRSARANMTVVHETASPLKQRAILPPPREASSMPERQWSPTSPASLSIT